MTRLYDIPKEIEIFEDRLINGGGELTPELEKEWSAFVAQGKDKLEAAAFVINSIEGDIEQCEAEVKRLKDRAASSTRNVDRLRDLTLYALKAMGGKVKTSLISLWVGCSGKKLKVDLKPGTDLEALNKTHPQLVRVSYEPRLDAAKALYEPIWNTWQACREEFYSQAADEPTPEAIGEINRKLDLIWKELLLNSGLPDCFTLSVTPETEYLRIK
jgi:hypothetical protein